MKRVTKRKIFVIDLHRHPVAYYAYKALGRMILKSRLVRHDGALSILRSFRPAELIALAEKAGLPNPALSRSFPFRLILSASMKEI